MDSSSGGRARLQYTRRDDLHIIKYFLETKDVEHLGGNECWKRLEKSKKHNPSTRTWQSLKERFRKAIRPSLKRYNLTRDQLELFDNGRGSGDTSRQRMQSVNGLDISSDEDLEVSEAESEGTAPPRARSSNVSNEKSTNSNVQAAVVESARQSGISRENDNPGDERTRASKSFTRKRRNLYRESSPQIPLNTSIMSEPPLRYMPLNSHRNRSTSPPTPSPRKNTRLDRESRRSMTRRPSSENDLNTLASRSFPEEEFPSEKVIENVDNSRAIVPVRRRVRFDTNCRDAQGGSSPIIETASHGSRRMLLNSDDSDENLGGIMFGAHLPSPSDVAISSRTRSSCRANGVMESSDNFQEESAEAEAQERVRMRTRAAISSRLEIKGEPADNSHGQPNLLVPGSSHRVSTQDMLRYAVSDTQSDDSFHSARQSPSRPDGRANGLNTAQNSLKRRNQGLTAGSQEEGIFKKRRSDPSSSKAQSALKAFPVHQGLDLQINGRLKFPELPSNKNEALIAFLDLIKSTFCKHTSWGPHGDCPGLHEFLYFCKVLKGRIIRAKNALKQRDARLVDKHLFNLFDVPLCSRNRGNGSIDCTGVHRHFIKDANWFNLLEDLTSVYEAQSRLRSTEVFSSEDGIEENP